jgi:DDE family transposase
LGSSLQANVKPLDGPSPPDRDPQFRSINTQVTRYLQRNRPVISVDTTQTALVGPYKNAGQPWRPPGDRQPVNRHDFPDTQRGNALPSGVYDLGQHGGGVHVGCDHDPASVAVASLRRGWVHLGKPRYPRGRTLLICADRGGRHGDRVRLWPRAWPRLANTIGRAITVCHVPPGTRKGHTMEQRLCSSSSMNGRGQPLISHEVIGELMGATTTQSGLHVAAPRDTNVSPTQMKISAEERATLHIPPHNFHGEWN